MITAGALLGMIAIAGGWWWLKSNGIVSTDDASVKSNIVGISAKVSGQLEEIAVKEGDIVQVGQVLAKIDNKAFQIQVEQAQANLASAQAKLDSLKAGNRPQQLAQTAYSFIALRLIMMGMGLALTMSPLSNAAMATLSKEKTGVGSGVFNLFKNVGGSVGIAMMGTLLDQRQLFHKEILSNYVNTSSEAAKQVVTLTQGMLIHNKVPSEQAHAIAIASLKGLVAKQAAIMAYSDVFQFTAGLAVLGVIMAVMLKDNKKLPQKVLNLESEDSVQVH